MARNITESLTFDDVLLVPGYSHIQPADAVTRTKLTRDIALGIPIISSAMDTVTESAMAIAMAQAGGLGIIHRNMDIGAQVEQVRRVKRYESGMVVNPITIHPDATLAEALDLMKSYKISGIPVVGEGRKLVGILTNRDVRFSDNMDAPVKDLMTHENLITVKVGVDKDEAKKILHKHRIEKLLVVDNEYRCVGLITVKDIEKSTLYPNATKDTEGRLRVGAAIGTGRTGYDRALALADTDIDVIVIDTAHGHSKNVLETVTKVRQLRSSSMQVIAGNIATVEAAKALIDAGVDAVKVGIGPGSICTTRIVAGVGVPQLSAVMNVAEECNRKNVPVIADGGIRYSGDLAKAIAAGADCVMLGSMLAGTDEAPGEMLLYQGRSYKAYRGMGSVGAMAKGTGAGDRYGQGQVTEAQKFVPEGIEGRVPYKGSAQNILYQMVGGLRAAMGYTGHGTIESMRGNCTFTKITSAGIKESHVHDVAITKEAPNYQIERD